MGGEKPSGWVTAVDANTGAVRWKYHSDTPVIGGVTPTAGGVVLTGDDAGKDLKSIKTRMNAQKIAAFILNPELPMPRIFPEPRTAEDERDLHDVVAYVASWP